MSTTVTARSTRAAWVAALAGMLGALAAAPSTAHAKTVLVVAAHPDDEVLIADGRTRAALQAGDIIKVVVATNGDASGGTATGYQREVDSVNSALFIGLTEQDVIFLGYPDGSFRTIYDQTSPTAVVTSAAGQTATYGNRGLGGMEYHRYLYGVHGPYNRQTALGDFMALVQNYTPDEIYTHSDFEAHPDHQATALFVTQALATLKRQGLAVKAKLYQTIVWMPGNSYPWPQLDAAGWAPLVPFLPFSSPCVAGDCLDRTQMEWSRTVHFAQPPEMLLTDPAQNMKAAALPTGPGWFGSFARLDEFFWLKDFGTNVAATATVTASSQAATAPATNAVDGVMSGAPVESTFEWVSNGELGGAWLQLSWPQAMRVAQVNLWDRPSTGDNVLASHLTFSDGSSIDVGPLPPNGRVSPVTFAPKTVTWLRFTVDAGEGNAVGLSEIEVFGQPASSTANLPPRFVWGPVPAVQTIPASSSTVVAAVAHDLDGDPVQYVWSADSGFIQASGSSATFSPAPVSTSTWVTITAQALDGRGGSAVNRTYVQVTPAPADSLTVSPALLFGGDAAIGTVALATPAGTGGATVGLSSSSPAASVPASVTVPAGAYSATFPVTTALVSASTSATITASFAAAPRGATVTVVPRSVSSLTVAPTNVLGGTSAQGTITLPAPAGPSGVVVSLASTASSVASVPATVTVPAGGTSATFAVATTAVAAATAVTISATYGTTVNAVLTVAPLAVSGLSVTPSPVVGGGTATGTVTLNGVAPAGGALVLLASDAPSLAAVGASVTVPAGALAATFPITTAAVAAPVTVNLTATYLGASVTAQLTVTNYTPPPPNPNLLTNGEQIGGTGWELAGAITVTTNFAAAPDGTQHATRATSSGAGHALRQVVSVTPGQAYTFSFFAKNNGGRAASYSVYDNTHGADLIAPSSYFSQLNGSTWVRVGVTFTAPAGMTSVGVYPLRDSPDAVDVLLWAAKLEVGTAMTGYDTVAGGTLAVAPSAVIGGDPAVGTVTLGSPAPTGGTAVALSSSAPAAAAVPASVTVAAGATQATFPVTTAAVTAATPVTITAVLPGSTLTAALTVNPGPTLGALALSPTSVVGGGTAQGTVTLSGPAGQQGAVVQLTSGNTTAATVPSTVTVPAGATTATFTVSTSPVASATTVTVTGTLGASTASATVTVAPPALSSISLSPTSVVAGGTSTGTVTLAAAAPAGGATVALSSGGAAASVPSTVTVPAGATTAAFTVTTGAVTTSTTVTISATWAGTTRSATLTVAAVSVSGLSLSPANPVGGASATGTVTLSAAAPAAGATVALSSSNAAASVPVSVTVAAGATTATFTILTTPVAANTAVTITAGTRTATLTVRAPTPSSLVLSPTIVGGGGTAVGTVTLNGPAMAGGYSVTLASNRPATASVPGTVVVPGGATSATFTITTSPVTSSTGVSISATANGVTVSASLSVRVVSVSALALNPTTVVGGTASTGTVTLNLPAVGAGLTVTLASNNAAATVPASVVVPAGARSVTFTVATTPVTASRNVTITAAGGGVTKKATLTVTR